MAYLINAEDQDLLNDVREFCEKELKEQCKEYDISGEWPAEIYALAGELGYNGLEVPEEYGGLGLDRVTVAAIVEEFAKADAGFATTIIASNLALKAVLFGGNEEQKQHACDLMLAGKHGAFCLTEPQAGSDASNSKATAVRDGDEYILNGRKCFITNGGISDFYVITAMTDKTQGVKGLSAFLVDAGTPGLSFGNHENKMGIRTSTTCDVVMEDCRIPASCLMGKEGQGFSIAMKTLDMSRTWVGCGAVGIAQRAIDEAVAYGKQRVTFGKPILKNQALQFKVADMEIRVETARQMVAHALMLMDAGKPYGKESAIAKCYAGDVAVQNAVEAIQILGGYGYSREYPVEKLLRDAKIFQIFEGTNEIQRMVIGRAAIGKF
jgi:butyryl-CoA dehydrogenase